jgi:hypothetical protein
MKTPEQTAEFMATKGYKLENEINHGQSGWVTQQYSKGLVINFFPNIEPKLSGRPGDDLILFKQTFRDFLKA